MSLVADYSSDSDSESNLSESQQKSVQQSDPLKKTNSSKRIIKLNAPSVIKKTNQPNSNEIKEDAQVEKKNSSGFSISSLLPPPKNRIKSTAVTSNHQNALANKPLSLPNISSTETKLESKDAKKPRKPLFSVEKKHTTGVSLSSSSLDTNEKKSGPSFNPPAVNSAPAPSNVEPPPPSPPVVLPEQISTENTSVQKQKKRRSSFNGVDENEKEIVDFNVDQFYQANIEQAEELEAQSGLKTRIKTVGSGRHQLSSLIKSAKQNKEGLEELHARNKRAKTQAGAKYGFY